MQLLHSHHELTRTLQPRQTHTHALLHTPQVFHSSCRTRTRSASNSDCRRCCRFSLKRITFHSSFDFFFLPSVGRREGKVSHFVPILLLHRWPRFLFPNVAVFFRFLSRNRSKSALTTNFSALLVVCCTSSE